MRSVLKWMHLLGMTVFLGSIAVYILLTSQPLPPGSPAYAQLRGQILLGTQILTLPALLLTLATGLGLLLRRQLQRWQLLKAAIGTLMLVNTLFIVAPAIRAAAALAAPGTLSGNTMTALHAAVQTESIAGALNVLLALAAIGIAISRPTLRAQQNPADAADHPVEGFASPRAR